MAKPRPTSSQQDAAAFLADGGVVEGVPPNEAPAAPSPLIDTPEKLAALIETGKLPLPQRRCSVCGTVTNVELCPVDGSKMSDMEVTNG